MVRQVFPTLFDASGATPFEQQAFRPRPVADARNRLVQLQVNAPGATMLTPYSEERPYGVNPPDPTRVYEPGGGETPYDPLTSISTGRPYGEAGYAMPAWTPPTPPPRPGGLGQVLSKAVARPGASRSQAQGQQQAQAQPLTTNDLFGTVQLNPNQRNAPIYTALNVGSLFGGGGAPAPQPAAQSVAGSPATAGGRTALRPPSNSGDWTYDEEGNLVPVYPNVNQTSGEVSQAVSKPGWFRRLG